MLSLARRQLQVGCWCQGLSRSFAELDLDGADRWLKACVGRIDFGQGFSDVWNCRDSRDRAGCGLDCRCAKAARIPRLRFRRRGDARERASGAAARRGQTQEPGGETCRGAAWRGDRHRPHPLGDARQADRKQRPSARLAEACGRPQRHHREFPGVAPGTRRQGLFVRDRD